MRQRQIEIRKQKGEIHREKEIYIDRQTYRDRRREKKKQTDRAPE